MQFGSLDEVLSFMVLWQVLKCDVDWYGTQTCSKLANYKVSYTLFGNKEISGALVQLHLTI